MQILQKTESETKKINQPDTEHKTGRKPRLGARKLSVLFSKALALLLAVVLVLGSLSGCAFIRDFILDNFINIGKTERPPIVIPDFVGQPRPVTVIADELFDLFMGDYSTYNQLVVNPKDFGITKPEPRFWDYTYEGDCEEYEYYRDLLSELYACNTSNLNAKESRLYNYLLFYLETAMELDPGYFFYYKDPYMPSMGTHMDIPFSLIFFTFRTKQDIEDYLLLIADAPRLLGQADAVARERMRLGIYPNRAAVESTIEEAEAYVVNVSNNILVTFFEEALDSGEGPFASLSSAERERYAAANRDAVQNKIIPAYQKTLTLLNEILAKSKETTSIASLPYGKDYYTARMRAQGFNVTPEQAIKLLDEAMDEFLTDYFASDTPGYQARVDAAMSKLPKDAAGIMEYFNGRIGEEFPDIGMRPFTVDSASDAMVMEGFVAFYMLAPFDDFTENHVVYYPQNISDRFDLATTLAHEAFPGHLYQHNYFGLTDPHPIELFIGATAYTEGYAVYGQMYALRYIGLNPTDLTYANAEELFWRTLGARVDLGVNYEGWNVRQADTYLSQYGLGGAAYASYIIGYAASTPLLSLPYGLGPLEFYKMLDIAHDALGADLNLRDFHKMVLDNGALPFWLLEENFDEWLYMRTGNTPGK
ncbi:MAG: DUF885 domain-containing protein [Coriobacteriia bacterium]|nr:DUF885 domain-containing protein [Coriobacteriia bacterium]